MLQRYLLRKYKQVRSLPDKNCVKSGLLCPTSGKMKSSNINFNDRDTDTEAAALMKIQTNTRITVTYISLLHILKDVLLS